MSVLYLTFIPFTSTKRDMEDKDPVDRSSPEWRRLRQCAEVISLCRVRDGMGSSLEGVMGLLK
jgi:hypothetical protein